MNRLNKIRLNIYSKKMINLKTVIIMEKYLNELIREKNIIIVDAIKNLLVTIVKFQ